MSLIWILLFIPLQDLLLHSREALFPSASLTTGLLDNASHEIELSNYGGGVSTKPRKREPFNGESLNVQPVADLDLFFEKLYSYYRDKGLSDAVEPCDLVKEAIHEHPLSPFTLTTAIIVGYLALFCFLRFFAQLKDTLRLPGTFITTVSMLQTTRS
ncbi:autophagy 9 (APG9) [Raphanus sativus]|nr:autophagy 9 (APG9) [Raphanus sativus]